MKPSSDHNLIKLLRDGAAPGARTLAAEVPVSLTFNGVAHVVMMMTPTDLEEFALGFALAEQIIAAPDEMLNVDVHAIEGGILVKADIPKERHAALLEGRRNMVGQTGCGICGVVELEHAVRDLPPVTAKSNADCAAIFRALDGLREHQVLNRETGAVHAAALASDAGEILAVREDVGRHNALDKLAGHMICTGRPRGTGFVVVTSRCSHEMVQKAVILGTPLLVAVSAPTTLAVDYAKRSGLTLIALARSDSMLCFNDPHGSFGDQS
jgi:FdhD protein